MRILFFLIATFVGLSAFAYEKVKLAVGLGYSVCYDDSIGCAYTLEPENYEVELNPMNDLTYLTGKLPLTFKTIHNRQFKVEITISKIEPNELPAQYNIHFTFWDMKHPRKKFKGIVTTEGSMGNLDTVTIYGNLIKTSEFEMLPELYLGPAL